ncbi:hypothetical protein AMR41_00010 [Hapalosiphon sp. MRB220]|nr:hypothetical protein AMR41_00010 [Hapalosiphon sp. MRB220]
MNTSSLINELIADYQEQLTKIAQQIEGHEEAIAQQSEEYKKAIARLERRKQEIKNVLSLLREITYQ